ncbi:myc box-dependent-interacting protein 1-like isoform X2 [Mercenaria mercenaria]|uniref:myc box-dependent-interacting protein 1-like isoform X2 n=1 Tax=Mercenaria mercenaria TaxID=6596 RepID=UPI00234E6D13|nr:myc box-dependent-interacting protein 1-like isoform X2 [Mercenaria mercenaria]
MAENNKGGILNRAEKLLRRKKTLIYQSLGKQGKTTDEILGEDCQRLDKQQEIASKFQKDLRHYVHSARALSVASKTFYSTVAEAYEPEWENHAQITEILTNMDMLWQDYLQKLQEQVQEPLTKYLATIPQIRARVAKRGRKLIDFDNAKHGLDVQQNAKKKDDAKIAKAQEDLDQAQKIYEDLNDELHKELPEFYNSRVSFYGNLFQSLFTAENVFQTEAGKVWALAPDCQFDTGCQTINASAAKLASDHEHYTYTPRKNIRSTVMMGDESITNGHQENGPESPQPDSPSSSSSPSSPTSPVPVSTPEPLANGTADADTSKESIEQDDYENTQFNDKSSESVPAKYTEESTSANDTEVKVDPTVEIEKPEETVVEEKPVVDEKKPEEEKQEEVKVNGDLDTSTEPEVPEEAPPPVPASLPPTEDVTGKEDTDVVDESKDKDVKDKDVKENEVSDDDEDSGLYQVPPPAKPVDDDLPPNYLYTVVATHAYTGEDSDELTFDAQEIIYVCDYEDPEEQDPGWLMGVRKKKDQNGVQKGVFPENFTKRV